MKKKLLTFLFLFTLLGNVFAQTNFKKISIGAGAGTTIAYADLEKKTFAFAGYGTLDYLVTPYISIGLELQKGELAGGDIQLDKNNRQFINSYLTITGNVKFALGELLNSYQLNNNILYNLRGLYAGAGLGYLKNKISNVRYYGDSYYPGEDKSTQKVVPLNLGINFFFPDKWGYTAYVINANLQTSVTRGEGMDGYENPGISKNGDIYSYFSLGLKYNFGPMELDRKR